MRCNTRLCARDNSLRRRCRGKVERAGSVANAQWLWLDDAVDGGFVESAGERAHHVPRECWSPVDLRRE